MTYTDFNWITDRLAVGGLITAPSPLPFDAVLSMETYAPTAVRALALAANIDYQWCSILDGVSSESSEEIVRRFNTAANQLHTWFLGGKRALVHCYMGSSRAATTAIWYLVRYHRFSWEEAASLVKERRPVTDPNIRFEVPLRIAAGETISEEWLRRRLDEYCLARHGEADQAGKVREIQRDLAVQGVALRPNRSG